MRADGPAGVTRARRGPEGEAPVTGRPELALCHVRRQAEGGLLRVGERASRTLNYGHLERGLAPSGAQGEKRLSFGTPGLRCFAAAESAPLPTLDSPAMLSELEDLAPTPRYDHVKLQDPGRGGAPPNPASLTAKRAPPPSAPQRPPRGSRQARYVKYYLPQGGCRRGYCCRRRHDHQAHDRR